MQKDNIRHEYKSDPEICLAALAKLKTQREGWCELSVLAPTKTNGYIQVSVGGVNKAVLLGELCLWASGSVLDEGGQVSHLCGHPSCSVPSHVIVESAKANNARKGCAVWSLCKCGCGVYSMICKHVPHCIRFCQGFESVEDFRNNEKVL